MSDSPSIHALVALGLTPIEAAAYAYLLRNPATTGYRVAQGIGKPTANTYKALVSLADRGAVVVDDAGKRLYRAVPSAELLDTIERRFQEHRRVAATGLSELEEERRDDRLYRLTTAAQVTGRISAMLGRSRESAVLDLGIPILETVAGDIRAAADAGAAVHVRVGGNTDVDLGAAIVTPGDATPGACAATVVVDAREVLLATLDEAGTAVRHAVWGGHPDLARFAHRAVVAETLFSALARGLEDGLSIDDLEETFEAFAALRGG